HTLAGTSKAAHDAVGHERTDGSSDPRLRSATMIDQDVTTYLGRLPASRSGDAVPLTHPVAAQPAARLGLRWLAALLGASLVLAGCSAIPAQSVANPFGLDGQTVEVDFGTGVAALSVPGQGGGSFTFADLDVNLVVSPGLLTNTVDLATNARLIGTADGPATITLSAPELTVRLWHGAATYDLAAEDARAETAVTTTSAIVYARGTCFDAATPS